jgi:3-(3-hydroxy-phenyl)propionate hydroxylase
VPIFGVRGLNNGIADAHNAGWKLAYVLRGWADPELLASYTPERRGATLDVFANATKSTRFMTPPTHGWSLMRGAALSLALTEDFAKPFANPRQMQPYTYADSPLTLFPEREAEFIVGPVRGAAAVNVKLSGTNDNPVYLLDRTGQGFAGLWFPGPDQASCPIDFAALAARDPHFTVVRLPAASRAAAELYGASPNTFYLLRPDQHVAGRWRDASAPGVAAEVAATLDVCLGGRQALSGAAA